MASIVFTFKDTGVSDVVTFDATTDIQHTFSAEITEHPVERGSNIADHIRPKNFVLTLNGVITDYPLANTETLSTGASVTSYTLVGSRAKAGRSVEAHKLFERLQNEGVLCTVNTELKRYENMALKEYTVPKNANTKGAIKFTLVFQEVRQVDGKEAQVKRVSKNSAKKKVDTGNKPADKTPSAAEAKAKVRGSALQALFGQ